MGGGGRQGGGSKWRWKEVIPYSASCGCLHGRKPGGEAAWTVISEDDEDDDERRGGVSYDHKDNHAQYIRMLGDSRCSREGSSDHSLGGGGGGGGHRRRSTSSSITMEESEVELLSKCRACLKRGSIGQTSSVQHMQMMRHMPPEFLRCSHQNSSIVDDLYVGQAKCLLSTVGEWDFNVFNLDKLTNGRALFHISLHLFQEHNLIEDFRLDIVKLMRCFTLVEEGYHSSNPYHNAVHAADVVQAMHCYLTEDTLRDSLTPLERLTALYAAVTHDLDHPGVNQAFLIATSNHLATLYNNTSVLENHHWRSAMGILRESGVINHFDSSMWGKIETQMRRLILATDITRQPEFLGQFKLHLDKNDMDLDLPEHRQFILQIALKCADISNPCRDWPISRRWSEQVCEEFFQQGDYERKLHIPITPLCNREKTTVSKIQIGFMQFVVIPLFHEWQRFNTTPLSAQMIAHVQRNKDRWERIERGETIENVIQPLKGYRPPLSRKTPVPPQVENGVCEDVEEAEEEQMDAEEEDEGEEEISIMCHNHVQTDTNGNSHQLTVEPTSSSSEKLLQDEENDNDLQSLLLQRRHSVPKIVPPLQQPAIITGSGNGIGGADDVLQQQKQQQRRHSLPMVVTLSLSLEKLSEKLAIIAEAHSPSNGGARKLIRLDSLHPRIAQLSQSLDMHALERASQAGSYITSAHGLDKVGGGDSASSISSPHVFHFPPSSSSSSSMSSHPPPSSSSSATTSRFQNCMLRRASAPHGGAGGERRLLQLPPQLRLTGAGDTQPLLLTQHEETSAPNSGDLLARRHSDIPTSTSSPYFFSMPMSNSSCLLKPSNTSGSSKGIEDMPLLSSQDSLPSLQV